MTGAAKSPDGKKVVIRTASDAYEFEVGEDGDIAKAIVEGTPVVTPLPNEPAGGAIAYSLDGTKFLTLSAKGAGGREPEAAQLHPARPAAAGAGRRDAHRRRARASRAGWRS